MARSGITRFIDIGANLTDPVFRGSYRGKQKHEDDFRAVLSRAKENGLEKIIITSGCVSDVKESLDLCENEDFLYTTVGCHPTRCQEFEKYGAETYFADLLHLANGNPAKVVAIGECGLDYDRLHFCPKETQLKYFTKQLELAEATGLPMFLHCRNSFDDFRNIMYENRAKFSGGVVHSFDGTKEQVKSFLSLGLYIGINGCSLKTKENVESMCSIPSDRLLLETDAPWCEVKPTHAGYSYVQTKFPTKKKWELGCCVKGRNEPCNIVQVLEVVSGARNEDFDELASQVIENTQTLFFNKLKS